MIRVLFVCLGNVCRSPMAHAVFKHLVAEAGLSARIEVDSAGLGLGHIGEPAHRGTLAELARHGIRHEGRARQILRADLGAFDYILGMDHDNLAALRSMASSRGTTAHLTRQHIGLLLDFAPQTGQNEVPDPYYSGQFDEVYTLVRQGCEGLLQHIREQHPL